MPRCRAFYPMRQHFVLGTPGFRLIGIDVDCGRKVRMAGAKHDREALIGTSVLALGLWLAPATRPFLAPFTYLNTHIHELMHALTAFLTGGRASHIEVFADGGGVTPVYGGLMPLTAMMGYVGASLVGGWLIASSRSEKSSRLALSILGGFLLMSQILLVRGDRVGHLFGFGWTALILALVWVVKKEWLGRIGAFLGCLLALSAAESLMILNRLSATTGVHSDAMIMQELTGIPAIVFALLWTFVGIGLTIAGFKAAWSPARKPNV